MKIYFGGSIRGGRDDQALYLEIIFLLKNYGEVFTEHIGDSTIGILGQPMDESVIFEKDIAWLEQADIIVAEVTTVSLGVGYELGYASSKGKKILVLYRPSEGKKLSAMIRGDKNITCIDYQDISELSAVFDKILK